jgi:hypothetical protein
LPFACFPLLFFFFNVLRVIEIPHSSVLRQKKSFQTVSFIEFEEKLTTLYPFTLSPSSLFFFFLHYRSIMSDHLTPFEHFGTNAIHAGTAKRPPEEKKKGK